MGTSALIDGSEPGTELTGASVGTSSELWKPSLELAEIAEALRWAVANNYHVKVLWAAAKAKGVLQSTGCEEGQWYYWLALLEEQAEIARSPKLQLLLRYHCQELLATWAHEKRAGHMCTAEAEESVS